MKRKTLAELAVLFGILSLIFALWFYLSQLLTDPKEASSAHKNWATVFAVAGVIAITAGIITRRTRR